MAVLLSFEIFRMGKSQKNGEENGNETKKEEPRHSSGSLDSSDYSLLMLL